MCNLSQMEIKESLLGFSDLTVGLMVSAGVLEYLPEDRIQWLFGLTLTHVDDLREEQLEVGNILQIEFGSELVEQYVMRCYAIIFDFQTGIKRKYKMFFTEHNDIPYDGLFYISDNWKSLDQKQRFILLETEEEFIENYKERTERQWNKKKDT